MLDLEQRFDRETEVLISELENDGCDYEEFVQRHDELVQAHLSRLKKVLPPDQFHKHLNLIGHDHFTN